MMGLYEALFLSEFLDALKKLEKMGEISPCFDCVISRIKEGNGSKCEDCPWIVELKRKKRFVELVEIARNMAESIKRTDNNDENYRVLFWFLSQKRKKIEEAQNIEDLEKIIFWRVSGITILKGGIRISIKLVF